MLHVAYGLPRAACDAVAAGLGDASGNHVADHERVQVHVGLAAEFCVSVYAPADAPEPVGPVRSIVATRFDQLFRAGPREQHAGISEGLRGRESGLAILLCDGGERVCGDSIGTQSAAGALL